MKITRLGAATACVVAVLTGWNALARPVFGRHGLVVSASDLASQAGIKILRQGGNAADAAVATAFALAVTRPYYASLGGGGFMLTRFHDQIQALDYREKAPSRATDDMFVHAKGDASITGGLASGIPGNVRGLYELHKKFGKLPWSEDLAPAVGLAEKGFMVTEELARVTHENFSDFNDAGKKYFSMGQKEIQVGDTLKQPALARALKLIQSKGADGFYKGPVARDIISTDKKSGGILDQNDLNIYTARWTEPLHANVLGADVYSMPPPSSGGALLLSELKMSEALKLKQNAPYGHEELHLMAEIMNRAFFDRQFLGGSKEASTAVAEIDSDSRISRWVATISPKRKSDFDPKKFYLSGGAQIQPREKENTTHYVVVDVRGNVVSATTTINGDYGSRVVTEKYGITLNNEMDDFTTHPGKPNMFGLIQGQANEIAPLKTPLSSMTPTIVEKNGKLLLALGAPGGPKIINAVYQVVYHALTTSLDLDQLVQAPRVHQQWVPNKLFYDETLSPDTRDALEKMGHTLVPAVIARVYAIRLLPDGLLEGAYDNRHEGGAAGF